MVEPNSCATTHRCFGTLKGRFLVLRYGLRWHEAESNHQTFVVCATLHNAIVDYRESAAGAYDLDVQRFGSSVGDFEPYGEDEKKLLRSERQVYRVIGRAGQAEEFELLSFAEEEAQLNQLRTGGVGSAGGSIHSDGRRRRSSSSAGSGGSSGGGGADGGGSSSSSSGDGGDGGGVIAGDDDEHEANSSSSSDGGDDDADNEHEAVGTGGGGRAARPAPGTREDVIAHYELREKLAEHVWYLKSHKLLSWDSGSSPLSNVGYNIDKEIEDQGN
jgi:hypothetical protein